MKELTKLIIERCWKGYKPVKGKKPYSKGSCVKEDKDGAHLQKAKSEAILKKGSLNKDEENFHKKKIEAVKEYISKQVKEGFISAAPKPSADPSKNQVSNTLKNKQQKQTQMKPMVPKAFKD